MLNTNDAPTLDRVGSSTIRVKENFSLALAFNATDEDHNFSYPDLVYVVDGQELRYQKHTGQTVGAYSIGTSLHGPNDVGAKSVMVADFNRDGLDDILELNSSNKIRLYLNNGNDTFGIEIPVTDIPLSVGQILVSDLSGDGYPDVVALEKGKQRILGWKWNNDKSNFLPLVTDGNSSEVHVPITNDFDMDLLHIADLNTDGLLDILIDANGSSRLSWIENLGQSNFAKTSHVILSDLNYSNPIHAIDTGDINGDGRVDILLATDDGISIMENDKGLFSEMVFIYNDTNGYPYSIKGVHLDNDDRLDLVASFDRSNLGLQSVSAVLLNTATNSFTIKTDFGEGNLVSSFEAKDLDNDGHMDLMAISNDGYLQFFSNSGNGVMAPVGNKLTSGIGEIYSAKFANFDNRLDDIQFSVSGGKDRDLFEFRPNFSSHLWFKQIPDYESPLANAVPGFGPNDYEVIIEVDSIGADGSKKSVEHTLKILVQNENDNPPEFISSIEFSHAENSMQVASLAAVDLDEDSVYWEILEGNETFDLSSDGKLVFKLPPDYESPDIGIVDNQYSVTVRATDSLFQTDQNITVNVINLNDNSPVVHNAELNGVSSIIIEENQFAVLELNITDADQDVGVLSTNFVNGKDSGLFKITQNTSSGNDLIEFKVPPNFEDPSDLDKDNIYTFDLNITDGIHDQIISVFVEVININDEAPVWLVSGGNYKIPENQKFVIDLNASDDFQNSIIFSLDNNWPDHEFFDLNQSSGELRFKSGTIPDFENPSDLSEGRSGFIDGVYEIMVDLKDPDHNASSLKFVFTVEDVDEFPSFIIPTLLSEEDDSLSFSQDDFNITDPEGDLFEFTLISNPSNGVLTNLANGEFNYRSKNNFNGTDSISFRITEGGTSQDFAVSINISPKNDFPLLKDDEIDYVLSDRSPVFLDVLKNDSSFPDDENSETLRIVKWEVDFDLSDTVVGDFDWSASLPATGTGPYFEGDQSFNFSPPPNFLGPLTLKYEVSDGNLTASANVFINVTQSPDLPGWRYFGEFGYFFDASNKWILHEKLGWVFVYDISKLLDSATWCWNDGVGWFWTGRPYFDYIFVNEFSKWMRWQGGVNDSAGWSLITDYETNQVVSPEMFQIQRVTSTLSSFTSATEVSDYIRNTEVFTEEQKKEILFELLLYKSSPTLEELGITLSF